MESKAIPYFEFIISTLIPIVGSALIVQKNGFFAGQIFLICWLPYVISVTFHEARLKDFPSTKSSLLSLVNLMFSGILLALNLIDLFEFFLFYLLGDTVAMSVSISYFFLFKKGINGMTAKETFGKPAAIGFALFFTALIYPYFGAAYEHISANNFDWYLILVVLFSLLGAIRKNNQAIQAIVNKRSGNSDYEMEKVITDSTERTKVDAGGKIVLFSLLGWFLGVGSMYVIYVINA